MSISFHRPFNGHYNKSRKFDAERRTVFQVMTCLLLCFIAAACSPQRKESPLQGLISASVVPGQFSRADELRNSGQYESALAIYDSLLQTGGLPEEEYYYAASNRQLCRLLSADTLGRFSIQPQTGPSGFSGKVIGYLLSGILETREGRPGLGDLHRSKNMLRDAGKEESFEYFLTLEKLGWCHLVLTGESDSAAHYYKEGLAMAYAHNQLSPHISRLLVQLAEVSIINRDFVSSLGYTEEGLRSKPDDKSFHELLILKGTLLRRMEQFDSAGYYYRYAERQTRTKGDTAGLAKLLRERILHDIILNDDSSYQTHMLALKSLPPQHASNDVVSTHRLQGFYHYLKGNVQESIDAYEKALVHFKSRRTPDIVQLMETYFVLAELYTQVKNYDKAEQHIYSALVHLTPYRDSPVSSDKMMAAEVSAQKYSFVNYNLLAGLQLARYEGAAGDESNLLQAFHLYRMIDSLMFERIRIVEEDALLKFLLEGREIYSGGIESSYYLFHATQDTTYLNQAHLFMERSKSLVTYQDLLIRNQEYFSEVPREFREKELQLKARIMALKRRNAYNSSEMAALLREVDQYYEEMERRYPRYYEAKYKLNSKSFDYFKEMAQERQATFVQYFMSDEYVYFLKYDYGHQFGRIKAGESFNQALQVMKNELESPPGRSDATSGRGLLQSSHFLYQKLIKPLGGIQSSLLIIPDGVLGYIPFEVLLADSATDYKKANYLIKNHHINYAPSLKVHELNLSAGDMPVNNILGYAFTKENFHLEPLPGTKKELGMIGELFPGSDLVVRENEEVSREQILEDLEAPFHIIHIGLHATSSNSDRLENKIQCFSESEGEPAEVYGYEIAPLPMQAHTVVLTACQSGFGPVVTGEGAYSLARAFKQAGVTNVISSLWNLSDGSTATITNSFYRAFSHGLPASVSLSDAKREYLELADELTAHPHFWAGLVCQGN